MIHVYHSSEISLSTTISRLPIKKYVISMFQSFKLRDTNINNIHEKTIYTQVLEFICRDRFMKRTSEAPIRIKPSMVSKF